MRTLLENANRFRNRANQRARCCRSVSPTQRHLQRRTRVCQHLELLEESNPSSIVSFAVDCEPRQRSFAEEFLDSRTANDCLRQALPLVVFSNLKISCKLLRRMPGTFREFLNQFLNQFSPTLRTIGRPVRTSGQGAQLFNYLSIFINQSALPGPDTWRPLRICINQTRICERPNRSGLELKIFT